MTGSHHQQSETFEVIFNKTKFDALPEELKAILRYAAFAASTDQTGMAYGRYSKDLEAIRARGVEHWLAPLLVSCALLKISPSVPFSLLKRSSV